MNLQLAKRMDSFQPGIFNVLHEKKAELTARGKRIFDLSIGTPDFQPAPHVMEAAAKACMDPQNYKYAMNDTLRLKAAVCNRYKNRYGVDLEADEVMSVYGSQEGIAHIGFTLCDPDDVILVPDPGYPIFEIGPGLAGAKVYKYPLTKEHHFLPRLEELPEDVKRAAKFIIVSYPLNPVAVTAPDRFYEELIAFARKYEIFILHDNAYSDIIFTQKQGRSFLSYPGAKEVGAEFYSLSKSYNLTGARISFLIGNRELVAAFRRLRSQIDYGIFYPVQEAAAAALTGPDDCVLEQRNEYERRNRALCSGLRKLGWEVPDSEGTMFVWAPVPEGYENSMEFTLKLMDRAGVIGTPGSSFGELGEGYVRFALVVDLETIEELLNAIRESGIV